MFGLSAVTLAPSYLANNFPPSANLVSLFPPSLREPFGPTSPLNPCRRFFTALSRGAVRRTEDPGEFIRQIKMSLEVYIGRERERESARGDFNKTLDCKVQIEGGRPDVTRVSEVQSVPFLPARSPPMTAYLKRKLPLQRYRWQSEVLSAHLARLFELIFLRERDCFFISLLKC